MKKIIIFSILFLMIFSSVSLASELEILSMNSFVDSIGYLNVVGEVKNNSSNNYQYVQAVGSFKNSSDEVVDSATTYTLLETLAPGEKAPFKISIKNKENITKYNVQVQGGKGGTKRDLSILNSNSHSDSIGYLNITGEVKNNENKTLEYIQVIASFYNSSNEIVNCTSTYTQIEKLSPNSTSPFKISVKDKSNINSYSLKVQ